MERYSAWVYVPVLTVMVLVIVIADIAFFKNNFWARLIFNIGVVFVVLALCFPRFLR